MHLWLALPSNNVWFYSCAGFCSVFEGKASVLQDRRWQYIRAGRAADYHGPAVHPRHLSLWEKWALGLHHQYDPHADAKQRAELQRLTDEKGISAESSMMLQKANISTKQGNGNVARV